MRFVLLLALGFLAQAAAPSAQDRAGDVDHFILALSWSPTWCAEDPDRRDGEQCRRRMGFVVHGLWPQHRRGWPEFCRTDRRDPSRRETAAMADIMGSGGLAWHAWRKHGRCTGLDPADYFAATRRAFAAVTLPTMPQGRGERISPAAIEAAFLAANPSLRDNGVLTKCSDGIFDEIRLCLDADLSPQACMTDNQNDCRDMSVRLPAAR